MNLKTGSNLNASPKVSSRGEKEDFTYRDYYKWMNEQLTQKVTTLATALLGNPDRKTSTEWRWGKKGELVVYVAGERQGRFQNFEEGKSGDALELVKQQTGYTGKNLSEWVKGFIGYQSHAPESENHLWKPIVPTPPRAFEQDIAALLNNFAKRNMAETGRYCYRDTEGNILGYVVRFDGIESKLTLPLTYCCNPKGEESWRWKGFPLHRPPYGAEKLKDLTKAVLIVEGEKTAEAAKKIFPQMTVLSWAGGTGSVHLTDWSCLAKRQVVLWPDNDEPGKMCMERLEKILIKEKVLSVKTVLLPSSTPKSWDLADELPESWDRAILEQLIA